MGQMASNRLSRVPQPRRLWAGDGGGGRGRGPPGGSSKTQRPASRAGGELTAVYIRPFRERTEQGVGQGELPRRRNASLIPGCTKALPKLSFLCFKF